MDNVALPLSLQMCKQWQQILVAQCAHSQLKLKKEHFVLFQLSCCKQSTFMQSAQYHVFHIFVLFVSDFAILKWPLKVVLKFYLVFLSKRRMLYAKQRIHFINNICSDMNHSAIGCKSMLTKQQFILNQWLGHEICAH